MDTEVIELYSQILAKEPSPELFEKAKQQLYQFIVQLWQGN
jgi:NH3-dependent NAD+ synthetase